MKGELIVPLKIIVGLTKKITDSNYGSRGASVGIEAEADASLAAEPAKLQQRVRELFSLVRASLTEELNAGGNGIAASTNGQSASQDADSQDQRRKPPSRPATQSQVKAIRSVAQARGVNVSQILRDRYHVTRPEDLSIREASDLIDALKGSTIRLERP
jgi:hypothetical protein